VTDEFKS